MRSRNELIRSLSRYSFTDECGGILLWIPKFEEFLSVSFGDGSNCDDEFDDYLLITTYSFCDSVVSPDHFLEKDGGQLDFKESEAMYKNDITNNVFDALEFMYGEVCDFIPLKTYLH